MTGDPLGTFTPAAADSTVLTFTLTGQGRLIAVHSPGISDTTGIITVTGGQIEKVVIDDIENHTYYAKLYVNFDGKKSVIDCRPSDALALTAGLKVGLFVAEDVFQKLKL
jgi:hypothetical protein